MSDRWIPIKERQPIEGKEVLIHEEWEDIPVIAYLNSHGSWVSAKSHIDIIGDASMSDGFGKITHWMDLPAPPKQEDRDG